MIAKQSNQYHPIILCSKIFQHIAVTDMLLLVKCFAQTQLKQCRMLVPTSEYKPKVTVRPQTHKAFTLSHDIAEIVKDHRTMKLVERTGPA